MAWVTEDENNWQEDLRDGYGEPNDLRDDETDPDLADQDFYCEMRYADVHDEETDPFILDLLSEIACDADDRVYVRDPWPGQTVGEVI